ncbi:DUF3307 domain-containing protein [Clostridium sp. SHJSY1]|uniref:DUF3307 domain-containing protein n=1 Tax=Clostridium sp. SHJSY1 TaxID=2942483 RepID=UPI0028744941|nr:DUF3307 domain-containing protein [Clostridium sp. SHJSY1]MDS0524531.1 DUF3307 domain-containing protein [Clostridium sp. SHJSY1]
MITLLLITLISHLIGDFVFQTDSIARGRNSCDYKGFTRMKRSSFFNLIHGGIHGITLYILIIFFDFISFTDLKPSFGLILPITLTHFLIDLLKPIFISIPHIYSLLINKLFKLINIGSYNIKYNRYKINFVIFIIDQLLHISAIFIIFKITLGLTIDCIYNFINSLPFTTNIHDKILVIILIIIFSTYAAAYFSKALLDSLKNDYEFTINNILNNEKTLKEEARNGGFTIGILERLFIILGIVMNHPTIIPIVLTVKSIARYKKFSNDSFVEYYIIGTFFSFVIAILCGAAIAKII